MTSLRDNLVRITLQWEEAFGNAPSITSVISEYDAAILLGCSIDEYSSAMKGVTAVQKGFDFKFRGERYQVKGNRPSGKPGSFVTKVPKCSNYDWDYLIWILYDKHFDIQEAWLWTVKNYTSQLDNVQRISPTHMRQGTRLA